MKLTALVFTFLISSSVFAAVTSGKINNKPFQFASGKAVLRDGKLQVNLWNQVYPDPCAELLGSTLNVRLQFLPVLGKQTIDPNSYENLVLMGDMSVPGAPENNMIASKGGVEFTAITETEVRGVVSGELIWMKSSVAGEFTVPFCSKK